MSFRIVLVEKAKKVSLDLNSIVINYNDYDYNINIDEISTLVFDDPMCNISLKLLAYLCEKDICVILTDKSHNPIGTVYSLNNHTRTSKKIMNQIDWNKETKMFLWEEIVKSKISNQILTLEKLNIIDKIDILKKYVDEIKNGDSNNREGLASRIYFKELFGHNFLRFNEDMINWCLNYSYQIVRSKIAQEIISLGYITQLGINHRSEYNFLNLADDFIEPYRGIVDYYVFQIIQANQEEYLSPSLKYDLINILNEEIIYDDKKIKLHISIKFYVQSLFSFMETGNIGKIIFPKLK